MENNINEDIMVTKIKKLHYNRMKRFLISDLIGREHNEKIILLEQTLKVVNELMGKIEEF